jgi:predicted ArsR family transcriptional regulator
MDDFFVQQQLYLPNSDSQHLFKSMLIVLNTVLGYNPAMQYTRKQIIEYLRKNHKASIPELSQALNLTVGNIRHHINDLEGQKVVVFTGQLPAKGRGRPTKLYALAQGVMDHNLVELADSMLKVINQIPDENPAFEAIASEMTSGFQADTNPIQRLNRAIQWLNERHYRSRWEASPTGPRVILGHCPYGAIQDTKQYLCQVDSAVLSALTGTPMRPEISRDSGERGTHHCVFITEGVKVG